MICSSREQFRKEIHAGPRFRWRPSKSALRCCIAASPEDFDSEAWIAFSQQGSIFLDINYLQALQNHLPETDRMRYCMIYHSDKLVGIAVFHLTTFLAESVQSNLEEGPMLGMIRKSLTGNNRGVANVLISGNSFATGEHGFLFSPEIEPRIAMDALCYALTDVINEENSAGRKISAVIAKDFYPKGKGFIHALRNCGFREFQVDPTMILPVLPEWNTFDDYLESLNTKFRTKAKAALKRSSELEMRELDADEFDARKEECFALYQDVLDRAEFKLGKMTPDAFVAMKRSLGTRMIVRGYFLEDILVGFLTALECGDRLDAHLVGINYSLNSQYAIYSSMLYDYIDLAIQRKKQWVIFGRTAAEIKSSVGAFPVDLTCGVRHPGRISNILLKCLFAFVKPSVHEQRNPWKKTSLDQLSTKMNSGPFSSL